MDPIWNVSYQCICDNSCWIQNMVTKGGHHSITQVINVPHHSITIALQRFFHPVCPSMLGQSKHRIIKIYRILLLRISPIWTFVMLHFRLTACLKNNNISWRQREVIGVKPFRTPPSELNLNPFFSINWLRLLISLKWDFSRCVDIVTWLTA